MNTIIPTDKEAEFIEAYFEAINFTDGDIEEQSDQDYDYDEDFARESVIDCLAFYSSIACYLSFLSKKRGQFNYIAQAGHDFWFTRNGHGVGFWDRPEIYSKAFSDMFTTRAQGFGEVIPYYTERMS